MLLFADRLISYAEWQILVILVIFFIFILISYSVEKFVIFLLLFFLSRTPIKYRFTVCKYRWRNVTHSVCSQKIELLPTNSNRYVFDVSKSVNDDSKRERVHHNQDENVEPKQNETLINGSDAELS